MGLCLFIYAVSVICWRYLEIGKPLEQSLFLSRDHTTHCGA